MVAAFAIKADRAALMAAKPRRVPGSMSTKKFAGALPCLIEHGFRCGLRQFAQRIRNHHQVMLFAGKAGAQILLEPLRLLDNRRFALLRQTLAHGDPTGVRFDQRGLLKLRKLFSGGEQRCTRSSAEIEQAGNFMLCGARNLISANTRLDSRIRCGQSAPRDKRRDALLWQQQEWKNRRPYSAR